MEKLIVILISIGLAILDNSLIPFFSVQGVYPSILFTFAIAYSLVYGREKAVLIGSISGILQDLFFFNVFGINSILNLLLCLLASIIGENIFKTKKVIPVISMFLITILKYMGIFIICYFLRVDMHILRSMGMALYNAIVMFFVYELIMKIPDEEYKKRPWRFK
ncbi:rod shape-determining protein MreD [Clostridium cagae]|uniref:rod shape-determining protein MreD n=1 Tax=Clostridium TaxID=1485 RepID=UPI0002F297D7|nr:MULTISPECIES: rod shape-determining protein MreD [Clostridium]MBN1044258.1 rod shape-determining protein MreD [Clostridium botulinum]MBN1050927.1 rod shape-determining protein MreD [Clostridium botulinum]MBN1054223.1 rod shape-determining protein MreD [Clostridium botulinum]MBZ9690353.1 rod shape-determining protein MreD [Clostridium sp. M14]NFG39703.1 rod shape-determining protein MreD [Clostridium botulinum]